jgi:hypothetical protein
MVSPGSEDFVVETFVFSRRDHCFIGCDTLFVGNPQPTFA